MIKYSLWDRRASDGPIYGISCDEDGVFIAGEVPLIERSSDAGGGAAYRMRSEQEVILLLTKAYGRDIDFSSRLAGLDRVARYMTEGKWVLAKIVAVHLRLPDLADDIAVANLMRAESALLSKRCARVKAPHKQRRLTRKRDVSNEPRIPGGQSGGGEWTTGDGSGSSRSDPYLIPAQAITVPIPAPFELPLPPTEITPFPLEIPGNIREPIPVNPYPDDPECAQQWAHAYEFCRGQLNQRKLKPGYSGFGKNFTRCVLGMVSQACGGNPTA